MNKPFGGLVQRCLKCVGNKAAALDYAILIEKNSISGEIVCVDRDLDGITQSWRLPKCVVQTRGYSWENDLWTLDLCDRLLQMLAHVSVKVIESRFRGMERRLRVLSVLDAAMQPHAQALLSKASETGGIGFKFSERQPVPKTEMGRLFARYRSAPASSCGVSSGLRGLAAVKPAQNIIQGHLWSNAVRGLLMHVYKAHVNEMSPNKRALLNLALHQLQQSVDGVLGLETADHYRNSVGQALS